ncbi:MAG: hypothetical protein KBH15_03395 [Candidatus Atribacteria bacterium]|nr:hypothetical protein [Candidatus Atribacteria bacterium]
MKSKFFLLVLMAILAVGCARGEQIPWEEEKSLRITTTWREVSSSYIYYIAISTDPIDAPSTKPDDWNRFYVVKWENNNFFFKEPNNTFKPFSSSLSGGEMVVTLSLINDLDNPDTIRVMVVSTDKGGNVEDSLDGGAATFRPKQESSNTWNDSSGDTDGVADLLSLKIEAS